MRPSPCSLFLRGRGGCVRAAVAAGAAAGGVGSGSGPRPAPARASGSTLPSAAARCDRKSSAPAPAGWGRCAARRRRVRGGCWACGVAAARAAAAGARRWSGSFGAGSRLPHPQPAPSNCRRARVSLRGSVVVGDQRRRGTPDAASLMCVADQFAHACVAFAGRTSAQHDRDDVAAVAMHGGDEVEAGGAGVAGLDAVDAAHLAKQMVVIAHGAGRDRRTPRSRSSGSSGETVPGSRARAAPGHARW